MIRVLVIGGIDPGGGAGLTADARTLAACRALAMPVVLALTVQNRRGVSAVAAVDESLWRRALAAALADGPCHAIKVGMLAGARQAEALARELVPLAERIPLVVDPVLSATAGGWDPGGDLAAALRRHLVPIAAVLTPNLPELTALAGAGGVEALLAAGCRAVLVKGGHADDAAGLVDVLHGRSMHREWRHPRLAVGPVHGTGCALASALAAGLGRGLDVAAACDVAIALVQAGLAAMGPADDAWPRPLLLPPG